MWRRGLTAWYSLRRESFVSRLSWSRSSVTAPISELEYDLMGEGYAVGFGRALTTFLGCSTGVLIARHRGHLYSAITARAADARVPLLETSMASWTDVVLPRLVEHFKMFADLADEPTGPAFTKARGLFAECIALHHALLLPARQAILDLAGLCRTKGVEPDRGAGQLTTLTAITPIGTVTVQVPASPL